jgi:copper(I)-binding protein
MLTSMRSPRSVVVLAAVVALLAAGCGDDDAGDTTTTAADATTTTADGTTTTENPAATLPDASPTVAELWTEPTDDSGPDVDHKVYAELQGGASDDTLTGVTVESDLAESAELTPDSTVDLPATDVVALTEDGTHIVLRGLAAPLEYNRSFYVTFEFENADDLRVEGAVRDPADPVPSS